MTDRDLSRRSEVASLIRFIRGQRVMLDSDLAALYNVRTEALIQAIKRNLARFPDDFMFQLSRNEYASLRSQSVISKPGRGGRRYLPYVFTEQGVAMLSSVLRSERAVAVNVEIMRAFVRMRSMFAKSAELTRRLDELERRSDRHDQRFQEIFAAIRELMTRPETPATPIGFHPRNRG